MGCIECIGLRELLDYQQKAGAVAKHSIADQRLVIFNHTSDITEGDIRLFDIDLRQVVGRRDG